MPVPIPRTFARSGALIAVTFLALACDRTPPVASTDSALARDLTLATGSTPFVVPPTLADTAISSAGGTSEARSQDRRAASPSPAPEPARTPARTPIRAPSRTRAPAATPAPEPVPTQPTPANTPAPAPATDGSTRGSGAGRASLGTGTVLAGITGSELCSLANRPGDRLVATLSNDVVASNGARLPAGTPILVEMAPPASEGDFSFRVKAVQVNGVLVPVEGTVSVRGETTEREVSKGGDKGKVVAGAVIGAILGKVLGGGTKGAVIGAAAGGAAGSVAASRNTITEKCLPSGAVLTVTLTAPLVLTQGAL